MKKIGILTFHRSVNNGAVLQAYSLSTKLKDLFPEYDVEIIDYCMTGVFKSYHYNLKNYFSKCSFKMKIYKLLKLIEEPFMLKRLNKRTRVFEDSLEKLCLSNYKLVDDSYNGLFKYINETYDVLIVGSDAVWNYVSKGFPNAYFPDKTVECIKISYAASCYGMVFEDFSIKNKTNSFFLPWIWYKTSKYESNAQYGHRSSSNKGSGGNR